MRVQKQSLGFALVFLAAFSMGFAIESRWGRDRSLATREDVLLETARVLNALQPLLRPWETRTNEVPKFTDYVFPDGLPVDQVIGRGIMTGFPDMKFQPGKWVTRGEAVVIFSRLIQVLEKTFYRKPPILPVRPSYADIPEGHWLNGDLARIGGVGGLRCFAGERFQANDRLRLLELRLLRSALLDYFGENLFILSGTPPDLVLLPKGVFQPLTCHAWSYSFDQVEWLDVPPNGRIHLRQEGQPVQLWLRHPDCQTIGPVDLRSDQLNFWLLLVRKDLRKFRDRLMAERQRDLEPEGETRLDFHLQALRSRLKKPVASVAATQRQDTNTVLELMDGMREEPETIESAAAPSEEMQPAAEHRVIDEKTAVRVEPKAIQPRWAGGPKLEQLPETPVDSRTADVDEPRSTNRSASVKSGIINFSGVVVDSLTGKGVSGAVVLADKQTGETADQGEFQFDVSAGSLLDLTIYREGYEPLSLKQRVDSRNSTGRFMLKPLFAEFQGFVTSEDTGEPVAGAVVRLGDMRTRSGPDGRFRFSRVRPTFYQLSGQADGFMEAIEFVHVNPSRDQAHELKLKPVEHAWEKLESSRDVEFAGINQAKIETGLNDDPVE